MTTHDKTPEPGAAHAAMPTPGNTDTNAKAKAAHNDDELESLAKGNTDTN